MRFLRGARKRWLALWITLLMLAGVPALADFTLASFPITFGNEFARISGIVHIATGGVTNAMLQNSSTTVNGTTCTLGSTCTPSSTGITQLTGDVTAGPGSGSVASTIANNAVTNAKAAQVAANTIKGNPTGSTANASDMSAPSCPDTGGNHLNWTTNSGLSCGTSQGVTPLTTGTSVSLSAPRAYFVCTSTCTVTPPVPSAGYEFCVSNDNNVSTVITLAALGSSAMYQNTANTAYGTAGTGTLISTGATGTKICIVGRDSTHYLTTTYQGTWVAS